MTYLGKQGIITTLPKPSIYIINIANWRPISLLNINYKIATKSSANRSNKLYQN